MNHRSRHLLIAVMCCLLAATALGGQTIPVVSSARLRAPQPGEWLTYGREYNNQRFSPLAHINRDNVSLLTARWRLQLELSQQDGLQVTPLVADGRMYVTTSHNVALAFDLRTRAQLWRYEHKLGTVRFCCGPSNRGAALGYGLVYMATLDAHVVALDATTGAVRWDVTAADAGSGYSFTMAPLVIDDLVIVGSSGGEFGTRGWVAAYAALSGALVWRWYTVPSPEEGGWWGKWAAATPTGEDLHRDLEKEHSDAAKYENAWKSGGVPVWANPAYDADLGLLYIATGNPTPSNDGTVRPGDNLYGASVVALDVKTGKLRWYFQAVPHDLWDYDFGNPPVIIEQAGRKLLLEAGKMGFVYVLDASTGGLVRRSEAFVPQKNLFLAPTVEGIVSAPGPAGGANWPPSAYSPLTNLLYVVALDWPFVVSRQTSPEPNRGEVYSGGQRPEGTPQGVLSAINPSTGKIAWQLKTDPLWSGALVTAGGILFAGDVSGWYRAYDVSTGQRLWEFNAGVGVNAPGVSFELDGEQYIAVAAGGSRYSKTRGSTIIVFGLGAGARPLPPN
jgi:alcohol dehydrogenase (cytochrome c)